MGIENSTEKANAQQGQPQQQQSSGNINQGSSPVISYAKMTASPAIQFGTVPSPNTGEVPLVKVGTVPIMTAASPSTTTTTTATSGKPLPLPPRTHSAPPEAALIHNQQQQAQQPPQQQPQPVKEKKSALPVNAAPYEPSVPFAANPMVMFGAPRDVPVAPYFFAAPAFGVPTPLVIPPPVAQAPTVPIIAQPPVKKPIRIQDPNTKQDISLVPVSKPSSSNISNTASATTSATVTAAIPTVATNVINNVVESSPASSVHSATSSTTGGSVKRGISIIDPNSGKPVDLGKISSKVHQEEKPVVAPKLLEESLSNLSLTEPTPQASSQIGVTSMDIDLEEGESEEEEEEEFSGLIRPGMKVFYPSRVMPYDPPKTSQDIWRYARSFLLQFMTICTQKPDKAAEMARIAAHQQQSRRTTHGRHGKAPKKVYSEAELQAYAQMLSRAENAWTPVADASTLAEEERIIREVKGILNKLTADKFDTLTKQVEDLGITSANVLSGVIDVIFEKATMEPKFAEMYAAFCIRIVQHEVNVMVQTNAQATAMDSLFRRMLIEKCQQEYQNKRAWSEERMRLAAQGIHVKSIASGDLNEQDYAMIRKKRAVLGNIRFIGELFKVKLIGPRIMHACLTEMLTNVEEPEEDEVECVCRLFSTVNQMLESSTHVLKDEAEKRDFISKMAMYRERLGTLSKHPKLCSRVRFMVMDVLDAMRKQQQQQPTAAASPAPRPTTPSSATPSAQTSSKLHVKQRRHSEKTQENSSNKPVEQDASGWSTATQRKPSGDGWSTSSNSNSNSSGRGRPSSASPQPIKVFSTSASSGGNRRSAAASPTPVVPERVNTPSSTNSMNRFDALEDVASPQQSPPQSPTILAPPSIEITPPSVAVSESEEKKIKVFLSIYNGEYLSMKNIPALLEYFNEIQSAEGKAKAVEQLVLQAMEKHSRFEQWREYFVPVGQQLFPLLPGDLLIRLLKGVFASAIELSMDIPLMTEYCGALIAMVLVPTGVEHVTPLLPWKEDEMYAVRIFSAFLKYTPEKVDFTNSESELLEVLKRYERMLERTAEKAPALESAFFALHFGKYGNDCASLKTLFSKYPNAARTQLEEITFGLLTARGGGDEDVVSEFVMTVSPLLDDRMQPQDWQAIVRGVSKVNGDLGRRIRELQLIPEEYFLEQQQKN